MDIDTGDSPLVSSRPYTLPLKHYEWVQREIESLEHAGVITKSMSKWASPIVVVPKKSAPGEPPKRRLCVDFKKVNKLQQEVIIAGKTKGQISIHPLPKIDEMYAKLKGARFFQQLISEAVITTSHWVRVLELKRHSLHLLVSTTFLWYHLD